MLLTFMNIFNRVSTAMWFTFRSVHRGCRELHGTWRLLWGRIWGKRSGSEDSSVPSANRSYTGRLSGIAKGIYSMQNLTILGPAFRADFLQCEQTIPRLMCISFNNQFTPMLLTCSNCYTLLLRGVSTSIKLLECALSSPDIKILLSQVTR